jgi:hypothetical protein
MGINWIGGGGVIGGAAFGMFFGGIWAFGMIVEHWHLFALLALALVILHCLAPKPAPPQYSCSIEELRARVVAARKG